MDPEKYLKQKLQENNPAEAILNMLQNPINIVDVQEYSSSQNNDFPLLIGKYALEDLTVIACDWNDSNKLLFKHESNVLKGIHHHMANELLINLIIYILSDSTKSNIATINGLTYVNNSESFILKISGCSIAKSQDDKYEESFYDFPIYMVHDLYDGDLTGHTLKQRHIQQVCNGIENLHAMSISHNDLDKPNILFKYIDISKSEFDVYITDFGCSATFYDMENNWHKYCTCQDIIFGCISYNKGIQKKYCRYLDWFAILKLLWMDNYSYKEWCELMQPALEKIVDVVPKDGIEHFIDVIEHSSNNKWILEYFK